MAWPCFNGNPARNNYAASGTDISTELWTYDPSHVPSKPVLIAANNRIYFVADGDIQILNTDGTFHGGIGNGEGSKAHCIDDAGIAYTVYPASGPSHGGFDSTDADGNYLSFFTASPGYVQSIAPMIAGGYLWTMEKRAPSSPFLHYWVVARNLSDFSEHHSFDVDPLDFATPSSFMGSMAYDSGYIYMTLSGISLHMAKYDATTGAQVWITDMSYDGSGGPWAYGPSVQDGKVYAFAGSFTGTTGMSIACCDAATGALLWRYDNVWIQDPAGWQDGPAVGAGVVIVPLNSNAIGIGTETVIGLNANTGAVLWTYSDADEYYGVQSSPAPVIGNDGYCLVPRRSLLRLALADGTLERKILSFQSPNSPALGVV